jgi:hypothetical protein
VARDGGRADEADSRDARVVEQRVDGDLVALDGSRSDGLSTNVLPQAIATGNIQSGTIAGKLNGVMPAQTPSGWRSEWVSTPLATCSECSPLSSVGAEQASSTTSSPRATSPAASSTIFPCSEEIVRASSSRCAINSSRKA